ncbi:MAG: nuclear transport factor 2 family protein [Novosphingobium sp.]
MSMTAQEMEQFVDDLYAATGAGDWDKAASMLTDDFFVTEADGLPMEGVLRGKDALKQLYIKVMGLLEVSALDRVQTTVGGDYAVTILTMRFADPSLAPAELCELFRFRDGKCCEIKPYYFDPAVVVAAAQKAQA